MYRGGSSLNGSSWDTTSVSRWPTGEPASQYRQHRQPAARERLHISGRWQQTAPAARTAENGHDVRNRRLWGLKFTNPPCFKRTLAKMKSIFNSQRTEKASCFWYFILILIFVVKKRKKTTPTTDAVPVLSTLAPSGYISELQPRICEASEASSWRWRLGRVGSSSTTALLPVRRNSPLPRRPTCPFSPASPWNIPRTCTWRWARR